MKSPRRAYLRNRVQLGSNARLVSSHWRSRLGYRLTDVCRWCHLGHDVRYHLRAPGGSQHPILSHVNRAPGRCSLHPTYGTTANKQDKKDDILVGVKSMALRFPENSRTVISLLSTTFIGSLTLAGHLAGMGPLYYLISCGGGAAHLAWQCKTVDFDSRPDCWSKFCSNGWLGLLIWLGIAGDYVVRVVIPGEVVEHEDAGTAGTISI